MTDMTVAQAAAAAGVSERTMRRWISEGRLAGCYKLGGRVHVPERAVREAAEPYGGSAGVPAIDDASRLDSPKRATDAQIRRARAAFEEIDRIRAQMKPPSGPGDTAVAYIRELRDAAPRLERHFEPDQDDPRR